MLTDLGKGWMQGEYLLFQDGGRRDTYHAKTRIFDVISIYSHGRLGEVKWYSQWRRYVYYPVDGVLLDKGCLRDIADFCELKTDAQKVGWKTQN